MAKLGSEASVSDLVGKEFGPYTVVQRLGVGGMAETFEAIRHGRSGFSQRVCLKLVRPGFRDDVDSTQLFEREARLAAKLQHSNIVGVIDFGEIENTLYMALELVDGADLQVLLDARKRLSYEHVALLGHELAAALEHAHNPGAEDGDTEPSTSGVIHRDISPSNVLISRYGEIKLTDFGLASLAAGGSRQSEIRGKFPYMATERLRADSLDGRSDLFSLGVVLFEALAGRRPYDGGNDPATIMLIIEGSHPSLCDLAPGTPPELCRVIESLIEPDRERRPQSAGVLVEQFEPFVPPPGVRRKLGKIAMDASSHRVLRKPISSRRLAESELPQRAEGARAAELPRRRSLRRFATVIALSALSIGVGAAALVLWPGAEGEAPFVEVVDEGQGNAGREPTPDVEVAPVEVTPVRELEREGAAPDEEESTGNAQPAVTTVTPARLTVLVHPWGSVWINGKPRGFAPLKNQPLKPGRYKISAGQRTPSQTQVVRLTEGQRKTIRFNLAD
ncbi:MAG: serine/threonine-protein kinase [Polyangiales bacterium]